MCCPKEERVWSQKGPPWKRSTAGSGGGGGGAAIAAPASAVVLKISL